MFDHLKTPLQLRQYLTLFNSTRIDNINNTFNMLFTNNNENDYINIITTQQTSSNVDNDSDNTTYHLLFNDINYSKLILSSSTISILKCINDLSTYFLFYDNITFDIFLQLFTLFDFTIYTSFAISVSSTSYASSLLTTIPISSIRSKSNLQTTSHLLSFQHKYKQLRQFLLSTQSKLNSLYPQEHSLCVLPFSSHNSLLITQTLYTIHTVLSLCKHFTSNISFPFQSEYIINTITSYEAVLLQYKTFIYNCICDNMFNMKSVKDKIIACEWEVDANEAEGMLFEASEFVNDIIYECERVYNNVVVHDSELLLMPLTMQEEFVRVCIVFILECVKDAFAEVKRCNDIGRSVMLKDVKYLQQRIDELINVKWKYKINVLNEFNDVYNYVNTGYYGVEEIQKYLFENVSTHYPHITRI